MSPLDRLLGHWRITMQHVAMDNPVTGRQHYERVLDGAFVLQRWSYDHPDFPDALGLLSETEYHYFDVRGVTRVFDLVIDDSGWSMVRIAGDGELSQRFAVRFVDDRTMAGGGEASYDRGASWQHDFDIGYERLD